LTEPLGEEHSPATLYAWAYGLVSGVSPDRTELIGFIDANSPDFSAALAPVKDEKIRQIRVASR
jgi:hypothetical protein